MPNHTLNPSRVENVTTNQTSSKNKKGKTKVKETFKDDLKVTDLKTGEVATKKTTQKTKTKTNKRGKTKTKTKFKEDFVVTNKDGKVTMKDSKKITSRNGKTRMNRNRAKLTKNYRA